MTVTGVSSCSVQLYQLYQLWTHLGHPGPWSLPCQLSLGLFFTVLVPSTSPRTWICENHLAGRAQSSKVCPHPTVVPSEWGSRVCRVCRAASLACSGGMSLPNSTGHACVNHCVAQNSRPLFISAVEDCEYTFSWPTAAACPVQKTVHDDCQVTNPSTGKGWHCQ